MKDRQGAIAIAVHPHGCLHIVKAILVSGYLQNMVVKVHTVVVANRALILLTQNIGKLRADVGHKGRSRLPCRTGKLGIESGQVVFFQIPVCCLPCLYPLLEQFLGKPVLQPNGILELENLALADNKHSQTRTAQKPAVSAPGLAPRIGDEPFVSRIARTARLDLTGTLRDLLPHANALVNQPLGGGFSLAGRMDEVTVASIEPVRDGFEIVFAIKGQLMMRYDATVATVTPTEPMPATR